MKDQSQIRLRQELQAAGADGPEINELLAIANGLKKLPTSDNQKPRRWRLFAPFVLTSLAGIAIGMALVIFSQTVLPGSRLYAIQKLSDNAAVSLDSNYRGTIMMKRAQQVKQLVAKRASPSIILATLDDYQREATAYKSMPANYSVFEYCKNNLEQAANSAPGPEREVINNTLNSLKV